LRNVVFASAVKGLPKVIALFWTLIGVAAGACVAFQAPINAQLAKGLGMPVAAAAISFFAGAVVLAFITFLSSKAQGVTPDWRAPDNWLYVAGGCLGATFVTASVLLTPRIGTAAVMATFIAGQLCAGILIDRFGLLGVAVRELSLGRIAGALLLCCGVVMIRMF